MTLDNDARRCLADQEHHSDTRHTRSECPAETMTVTPSKYHQPCWELTLKPDTPQEQRYLVWGPGEVTHDGHPSGKTREMWLSSWQANYGGTGGGAGPGETLDSVLGVFPDQVAAAFREAIGEQA